MEKDMASSRRKTIPVWMIVLLVVCLISSIVVVSCGIEFSKLRPAPAPKPFPDADIVYRGDEELGFINADGSGLTTIRFNVAYNNFVSTWESPMIAGDDEALIVAVTNYPGLMGKIFAAHPGEVAMDCGWGGIVRLAADGHHLLLETFEGQKKYLPKDCGTGNPPEKVYSGISGALSPDEQYSAEARWSGSGADYKPSLVLHDLKTGEEKIVGEGTLPVWSRDGQWLAYTGPDGIYIVQAGVVNAKPKRLVSLEILHPEFGRKVYTTDEGSLYYPPIASWSPDGRWLVYHEYHSDPVGRRAKFAAKYYSIAKVNVETGETTKLLDGGFSPFWRWPVEEP